MEEECVELVPGHESSEGLEPADGAFHDPTFSITPQWSSVLGRRSNTAAAMRADQLDPTVSQSLTQGITVGSPVIDQPVGHVRCDGLIKQRLDQCDFSGAGRVYVDSQWQAVPIDQEHKLAAFAALGGANAISPFLLMQTCHRQNLHPSSVGRVHRAAGANAPKLGPKLHSRTIRQIVASR